MYRVFRLNDKLKLNDIIFFDGYEIKIKKCNLVIIKQEWVNKLISMLYDKNYNDLISRILLFLDNDSSDDARDLLEELRTVRMILYNKYERYLDKKTLNKYLFKIASLNSRHQKHIATLQSVLDTANDERVIKMKSSELKKAEQNFYNETNSYKEAIEKADIITGRRASTP